MSTLNTEKIVRPADDRVLFRKSGAILQAKRISYYTSAYDNTAQNSLYDLPGDLGDGTAGITPYFSNSRLLFTAVLQLANETTWRSNFFRTYYKIGSGSWVQFNGGFSSVMWSNRNGVARTIKSTFYLGSLNTTSTVYFKISQIGHQSGGYLHLNQNSTSNNGSGNQGSCLSAMYVQEVSQ